MRNLIINAVGLGLLAAPAAAQHSDVLVILQGNQLATANEDDPNTPVRVFESELGELGIPGFTEDPGWVSDQLAPGATLGFNITASFLFWDGEQFVAPPRGEFIDVCRFSTCVTADGESGPVAGYVWDQAGAGGTIHSHLSFSVGDPNSDPGDPFDDVLSTGAFMLQLELFSSAHATSQPLAIVFNNGLTEPDFEVAVLAAEELLQGNCPGDVDGDGLVNITDLGLLLSAFNTTSGHPNFEPGADFDGDGVVNIADLGVLLSRFNVACE